MEHNYSSITFLYYFMHCVYPRDFLISILIQILKGLRVDMSSSVNYRIIVLIRIFDYIIISKQGKTLKTVTLQF